MKLAVAVLALVLFAGLLASPAQAQTFSDVQAGDWFYEAVETLAGAGALGGYGDGTFRPYEPVTRAQFTAIVAGVLRVEPGDGSVFSDVSGSEWFAGAAGALYEAGIVQGGAGGAFLPNNEISRQQAASLAMRGLAYQLAAEAETETGDERAGGGGANDYFGDSSQPGLVLITDPVEAVPWLGGFKDRSIIAATHALSVANAYRAGVISGFDDQRFYPLLSLTRGQAAGIVYQALFLTPALRAEPPEFVEAEAAYPSLTKGASGAVVAWLERRLAALSYRPGAVDGVYDAATAEAVMAFQKVERLQRTGIATDAVQRALAGAVAPIPRKSVSGTRVEIDLTRQVLFFVKSGCVQGTIPVATGADGTRTPTGTFSIQRKLPYWRESYLGMLYKPSYFYGGYAIHGSHSVPAYPASHGCVRVGVGTTDWLYPLLPVGTRVDIYY